ncbi:MAG: hypothetical protein RBS55_08190, partial [Bacteroidales bacterium]|nr:hypothetical protein [Bacteroidales bacterium]
MVFFKSFVSVILIIICCHIYGQEKASQRFSCFKYAIVEPFISNHNPLDNYGIGKKSIIALESIGMKCLDKE